MNGLQTTHQQLIAEAPVQQLREAFPEDTTPKYLILDRDKKFGTDVIEMLKAMEICIKRTA